ncbi:MAG: hypothetical protein JWQ34_175 [Mucilaginibacter sp.]|nr:hypothetical protein [Mucilaginibacter sp.]
MGGVGNQLFQYALGFALKKQLNKEVQFDTSYYYNNNDNDTTKRQLSLEAFSLTDLKKNNSTTIIPQDIFAKVPRFLERIFLPYYKNSYTQEKQFKFDPNIFQVRNNAYLDGYWQSPKYFEGIEADLRNQLVLKNKMSAGAAIYSDLINSSNNSISIHIRRSDYLSKYSHIYHIQTSDYYTKSINCILSNLQIEDITIFIFSDDIDWCKVNIKLPYKNIMIEDEKMYSYEGMVLMAQCKHNIIANSTYSWWGAWMNNYKNKIVVAPKQWFIEPNQNAQYIQSIYPPSWVCL